MLETGCAGGAGFSQGVALWTVKHGRLQLQTKQLILLSISESTLTEPITKFHF